MIASSRPLRFVAFVLVGWVAMRTLQLWPEADPIATAIPALLEMVAPEVDAVPGAEAAVRESRVFSFSGRRVDESRGVSVRTVGRPALDEVRVSARRSTGKVAMAVMVSGPIRGVAGPIGSPLPLAPIVRDESRWRASLWTIVRGDGAALPLAPQLGGNQAGVRLTYALDDAHRIMVAARLSTALGSRQREAAIGVDWQPTALPIHLIAEQRIAIEGARGGPSIGVIAGVGPTPVAAGFRLEAYGQAGAIARGGDVEGYADGALRAARPVAAIGPVAIDLGVGAWGGAQRGAARFDVGPTASVSLPAGGKAVRLSLDWRQRIAGDARPGSGPTFSIGTDF